MKKHRIFNKGDRVHALLSSYQEPNILIPVGGVIMDVKWDPVNPLYKIRITKFYDSLHFLITYFFNMHFSYEFEKRARSTILKPEGLKRVSDLEKMLSDEGRERYYVIVESVMCTKTKVELKALFERVQNFLISRKLKEIRDLSSRPFFQGSLSTHSGSEWDARFTVGWDDKFKEPMTIEKYLKSLT